MKHWLVMLSLTTLACNAFAQRPNLEPRPGYTLALPTRPGRLHLEAPSFAVVEASAKANGKEFGLRGEDKADSIGLLVFLFDYSEEAPLTSEKCRDAILKHEKSKGPHFSLESQSVVQGFGGNIAVAQYSENSEPRQWHVVRGFVASGNICGDIEFSSARAITPELQSIKTALASVDFDPAAKLNFRDVFYYASVLYDHRMMKEAAPIYEQALSLLPAGQSADEASRTWRRVATDQAVMSYGISGDIVRSRLLLGRAIQADPDYALNYYDLACADAEEGKASNAKIHLRQAFDRRSNVISGESLPDPTKDDSLLKLKGDKDFWKFVEALQTSR